MSRFYGEVQGSRGMTSRVGTPASGMWAHIRGWDVGVMVRCWVDADGRDVIEVTKTGGSGGGDVQHLTTFTGPMDPPRERRTRRATRRPAPAPVQPPTAPAPAVPKPRHTTFEVPI